MTEKGFMLSRDQGEAVWFLGSLMHMKADGRHTHGGFTVLEQTAPEGFAPPLHVHKGDDEAFYLLEGEIAVTCGSESWTVQPGGFVFLPRQVPHTFVVSRGPSRLLQITGPAGFEHFMSALGEPAGEATVPPGPPDMQRTMSLLPDWTHYVEILGPPPGGAVSEAPGTPARPA